MFLPLLASLLLFLSLCDLLASQFILNYHTDHSNQPVFQSQCVYLSTHNHLVSVFLHIYLPLTSLKRTIGDTTFLACTHTHTHTLIDCETRNQLTSLPSFEALILLCLSLPRANEDDRRLLLSLSLDKLNEATSHHSLRYSVD